MFANDFRAAAAWFSRRNHRLCPTNEDVMTSRLSTAILSVSAILLFVCAVTAQVSPPDGVDFERDIAPIIQERCIRCHRPGVQENDLSLATIDDLAESEYIVEGRPYESYLIEVVTADGRERPLMPKEGQPLSDEQVALLRRWIEEGAAWPAGYVLEERAKADRSWWSLAPLAKTVPPATDGMPAEWAQNDIDRFVYAKLAKAGLAPNPPADRRTLIRRLTYDLTGLPPTPEAVEAFVADGAEDAYERLVERLLESKRYGEHWGRHWLDVIRFGESKGFEQNHLVENLWPFRDYVIRAFNNDKPFDQFIIEQLAADQLDKDNPEIAVATAFLVCGPHDSVGNQDAAQAAIIRANTIDEMIRATSETFLGVTVGCARCHNHKFDPLLQKDYYALYATLAGVQHGARDVATVAERESREAKLRPPIEARDRLAKEKSAIEAAIAERAEADAARYEAQWTREPPDRFGTEEHFVPVEAKHVRLVVEGLDRNPEATNGYRIEEFEIWTAESEPRNVALLAAGGVAEGASRMAEDFADAYSPELTIDGKSGAAWLAAGPSLTITLAKPHLIDHVFFCSDRNRSLAPTHPERAFVGEYRIEVSLDAESWNVVATSHDRKPLNARHRRKRLLQFVTTEDERRRLAELADEITTVERQIAAVPPLRSWWVGQFQPAEGPFHVFLRGDPQRLGEGVSASSLDVLNDLPSSYVVPPFATEGDRRLALARWIAASDNPLTARVLANRVWHYHFGTGIVDTPSDFGYMGGRPTHPELLDWLTRQLIEAGWRLKPLHKMIVTSQAYRQSGAYRAEASEVDAESRLLWRFPPRRLSGEEIRDTMLKIAGVLDTRMGGPGFRLYRYLVDNVATYVPRNEHGPDTYRRAVYHQNARASHIDVMSDFDCPDPAFATPRRARTTTPLQALALLNHSFPLEMADAYASRTKRDVGDDIDAQIEYAFQLAYSREPTPEEQEAAGRLAARHGLRSLCRAILNSSELIYVD